MKVIVPLGFTVAVDPDVDGFVTIVGLLSVHPDPFIQASLANGVMVVGASCKVVATSGFAIGPAVGLGGAVTVICNGTLTQIVDGLGSQTGTKKLYSPGVVQVNVYVPLLAITGEQVDGLPGFAGGLP